MTHNVQPGRPHSGNGRHADGNHHNPLVTYELSGAVRWVEPDETRFVMRVAETNRHAGRFLGEDVTVDMTAGHRVGQVLPGEIVSVKARLPRRLAAAPDLLAAHSVSAA